MARVWTLGELAKQTQQHHATADRDRLAIMEQPSLGRYRTFLARIYCFEAPLEAAWISAGGLERSLAHMHLKSPKLVDDLEALGVDPHRLSPARTIRFRDRAEALGWLWVVHRNTLLHGLIHRYLASELPEAMRSASSYLTAFDGRAGALMRSLGEAVDEVVERGASPARIAAAANEAFRMQRLWYSCDVLSPRRPPAARPRHRAPHRAA